ncbi:MAG: NitT/TauT family transport system substrate-binding protein [Bradyrhizobium sp.]|jgi:NitT/TauT family transport system substrate-binding protein|nr:NitT/TauT family transport system substrate-binding protein [Bradyrhizobium sp.]
MTVIKNLCRSGAAGIAAAILAVTAGSAAAQDKVDVNIGVYPGQTFNMNVYVADAKGFYKEAGLNPTFITVGTGPLMNSMLGSGSIDFAFQPPNNVGVAKEQGLDQVIVVGNIGMPYVVIGKAGLKLPHKGQYPEVFRDLKGLVWGITGRGADSEMFMRAMASDAKLDPDKDVTWLGVGLSPTALPALKAGRVDTFITLSPGPSVAQALGLGEVLVDLRKGEGPANFKGVTYQGVTALRKTATGKPKAVEGLIAAHSKAYCWVRDPKNFEELLGILKTKLAVGELTDAQFRQLVKDEIPILKLTFPKANFDVWNEFLLKSKMLKSPLVAADLLWKTVPQSEPTC